MTWKYIIFGQLSVHERNQFKISKNTKTTSFSLVVLDIESKVPEGNITSCSPF